jgi:aryl sulfotransferase
MRARQWQGRKLSYSLPNPGNSLRPAIRSAAVQARKKTVVWIASYPKSGNTWVRTLACNLVFGPLDSAAQLNQLAPDVHELRTISGLPERTLLMKTHFLCSPQLPLLSQTAAAIYVVRHPADVMVSNFHYSQRSAPATSASAAGPFDRYVDAFIREHGDPRWRELGMGSWDENVRSWIDAQGSFPVLRLRYEDLLADAAAVSGDIGRFLGLTRTPEQVAAAAANASFERMREIEERDIGSRSVGIFYKPYLQESIAAGLRFMRSGRSGDGARALSAEQRHRFDEALGPVARTLGYRTADP